MSDDARLPITHCFRKSAGRLLRRGCDLIDKQQYIGIGDVRAADKAHRIIKKLQPDTLHGRGAQGGVFTCLSGSALRVFKSRVARIHSPLGGRLHFDKKRRSPAAFLIEKLLASPCGHPFYRIGLPSGTILTLSERSCIFNQYFLRIYG